MNRGAVDAWVTAVAVTCFACSATAPGKVYEPKQVADGGEQGAGVADAGDPAARPADGGDAGSACTKDCAVDIECLRGFCNEMTAECEIALDDGAACDDGLFCTVNERCGGGVCGEGEINSCDDDYSACEQPECHEESDSCSALPLEDGTSCVPASKCVNQATCQAGGCLGSEVDCSFSPADDDCNDAACDTLTGLCIGVPVTDGSACIDAGNLCTVGKQCVAGACAGGAELDCSALDAECDVGACDDVSGVCEPKPLPAATGCPSAADECNLGECDGQGACLAVPLDAGLACASETNQCRTGACDGLGACVATDRANGTTCERICFGAGACATGECVGSSPVAGCDRELIVELALGYDHSCALGGPADQSGTMWCWGGNGDGELGLGDQIMRLEATQVVATTWKSLAAGYQRTLAIKNDGSLWSWGENQTGALGLGDQTLHMAPEQVGANSDWTHVSSGRNHSCGIAESGLLWCWGSNSYGQLGQGDSGGGTARLSPIVVPGGSEYERVDAGDGFTCALRELGTLWCWGRNEFGALGLGDLGLNAQGQSTDRTLPTQVGTGTAWRHISAGQDHACALQSDRSLWCWGGNAYGQLGLGDSGAGTERTVPTLVGSGYAQVRLGEHHSCARTTGGVIRCWGRNNYGQLGQGDDGAGTDRSTPTLVTLTGTATAVEVGGNHSCAGVGTASLWCWGRNTDHELGLGEWAWQPMRNSPNQVW
jgi:alpha-tubulin suppressor-like RCC1 family protein